MDTIDELYRLVPHELKRRSGEVFCSGRAAFSAPAKLYVVGINPGGAPTDNHADTIEGHSARVLTELPKTWSAYRDDSWGGQPPGKQGMQPSLLHLFTTLNVDPGVVPCSNVIFVRSRKENDITSEMEHLVAQCWPFHAAVLEQLKPRVVLCLGQTAGAFIRTKVGATTSCAEYVERNRRKWRSGTFVNQTGLKVVVASHPSRAKWAAINSDPTHLVREAIADAA